MSHGLVLMQRCGPRVWPGVVVRVSVSGAPSGPCDEVLFLT